jgi:hypothetical protein
LLSRIFDDVGIMPVFVKPLYYTQSCLASIFYTAGVLLIQQDNHVGSALFACAIACGHLIAGILLAGAMVRSTASIS